MDLIESHYGASWEKIYEIIFPGAHIPHPCKSLILRRQRFILLSRLADVSDIESDTPSDERNDVSSLAAQSFQEFNEYNRIALPLLVAASLQSIVQSKIAPIEEEVRILLVDIVRSSQSTVAQNFQQAQQMKIAQASPSEATPAPAQEYLQTGEVEDPFKTLMPTTGTVISADVATHYQEPPFSEFSIDFAPFTDLRQTPQKQASDSGYGTNSSPCACPCHLGIGSSNSTNGMNFNQIIEKLKTDVIPQTQRIVTSVQQSTLYHGRVNK